MRKPPHQTGTPRGATPTQIPAAGAELPWPDEQHSAQKHTPELSMCVCPKLGLPAAQICVSTCPGQHQETRSGRKAALTHSRHMWGSTALLSQAQKTAQAVGADAPANLPTPDLCPFFQNQDLYLYSSAERSLSCSRSHKLLPAVRAEHEVHSGKSSKSLTSAVRDFSCAALMQQLKLSITHRRPSKVSGGLFPTCSYRDPIL